MRRTILAIAVALLALVVPACSSQVTSDSPSASGTSSCPAGTTSQDRLCVAQGDQAQQSAALVRSMFNTDKLGAVIVGVWKSGNPVVVGALGDSMTDVPATTDMHHRAGNISAALLTTALLQQVDAGKLSLTDKLSKWFPQLPAADQITVDMLARSTSGYNHYPELPAFEKAFYANPFKNWPIDDVIAYGVKGGPVFPPGTSWKFSDTNLLIIAKVLQAVTGKPADVLIQDGVLNPLGLKNTTPPITAALANPVLHSNTGERGVWEEATFWNPSWTSYAGGYGTTQDDARAIIEAVGKGSLVSKSSHEAQLSAANVGNSQSTAPRYYAMGIGMTNGWLFTNPNLQGYQGGLAYLPSEDLTIIVYTTLSQATNPNVPHATEISVGLSKILQPQQPLKAA